MRILLTNDDGIHAEGLATLQKIAAELSDDIWTVAPETEQSGVGRELRRQRQPHRLRHAGHP
jgi:5'-nucleotidase